MDDSHPDTGSLQQWWEQSLKNSTTDFGAIHACLYEGLYSYACKLLGDEELADDMVQELFIKIWHKRATIGPVKKVKSYFYTALRRQVLNQLRNAKLKSAKISLFPQPDIAFSQEEILVKKEEDEALKSQVLQLINSLPKRQREVIYLHYYENMSLTQIAEIMDINHQSVMNLKQRALLKMRAANILSLFIFLCQLHHSLKA